MAKKRLRNLFIPLVLVFTIVVYLYFILSNVFSIGNKENIDNYLTILLFTALVILAMISTVEFISNFFDKTSSWYTFFMSLCLIGMLVTSSDFIYISWEYIDIFHYVFFVGTMLSCALFLIHAYQIPFKNVQRNVSIIILFVIIASFIVTYFFHFELISRILTMVCFLFLLIYISTYVSNTKKYDFAFLATYTIVYLLFNVQIIEIISRLSNGKIICSGMNSIVSLLITFVYILIYLNYTVNVSRKAYEKEEFEKRLKELQTNVLNHQIDPHYIFNSLNTIKILYEDSHDLGVKALNLFSSNLRDYVAAADSDIVTLDVELKNVNNYIELENLKHHKPYQIIYNITGSDFLVPYFSLQPLVENIVKYSKINEKEYGHIIISAEEDDESYNLTIEDNGEGFDINNIKKTSYGINNSRERFRLFFNASFNIESSVEKGTKIVIKIPKENSNESHSR